MRAKNNINIAIFPYFLVLYEISNYLANDMYLPALPNLVTSLNITTNQAQQTLTAWFLGTTALQLVLGPLSDRLGRRPIFFGGGILFIIATICCSIAPDINTLLIARFFQGCAVCSIVTSGYASIHEIFSQKKAIQILAIMGSVTILAPAFGPLFGSFVLRWLDWRWIFGILAIWGMITLSLLYVVMPESHPKERRQLLEWRLIFKNYFSVLQNKKLILNTLTFCFTFLGMIAWIAAGPFLVITTFKFSTLFFAIAQALVFGSLILGNQCVKYLIEKTDAQKLINIGLAICFLGGVSSFIVTILFPHWLIGLIMTLMIFTFGSSLAFSPAQRIAIDSCNEPMGARMAIFSTLMSLFGTFGGLLVSWTYNGTLIWFGCLLLILSSAAYLLGFLSRKKL